jgi:phage repressor protein C with HTH and peptisase S24 domain
MFKHEDIWRGIDRLAQSLGYSPSGLAKASGLDPTSFNKSKRHSPDGKPRWPSTESIAKILATTQTTMSDFITLIGGDEPNTEAFAPAIPVIGFAQAGDKGYFDEQGYPSGDGWNEVEIPRFSGSGYYALEVSGDSMEPLYRKGDKVIVDPAGRLRKNDRVIVKTKGGEVLAKELTRKSADNVTLKSLNGHYNDRTFNQDDIDWIARIVWVSQ